MTRCQHNELIAIGIQEGIHCDEEPSNASFDKSFEGTGKTTFAGNFQDK